MAPGSAVAGVGWHDEWGTIQSFASGDNYISAFTACCSCGGGNHDDTASLGYQFNRHTWNDCLCKRNWNEDGLGTCSDSCCNPDYDPYGEWCIVQDESCEDSSWGYCRPSGTNVIPQAVSGCVDVAGWTDADGDGCVGYAQNSWCTASGGYDLGWHDEWGSFADMMHDGKSPLDACCACGAGTKADDGSSSSQVYVSADTGFFWRTTWNGCKCKMSWTDEFFGSCSSACCNLDSDPLGDWCMVDDVECEDADWGYCKPALLNPTVSSVAGCSDKSDFKDADSDSCQEYQVNAWCTASGGQGVGWHEEWGGFDNFDVGGDTALTACCTCGGGTWDGGAPPAPVADVERVTWNGCVCRQTWQDQGFDGCTHSCCNPDDDPFGNWCLVEDSYCEDALWGYCAPLDGSIDSWVYTPGGCTDSPGWHDGDGDTCANYREFNWCNAQGGYDLGWNEAWGTFADFAGGPRHESAPQACCACGRDQATGGGAMPSIGVTVASLIGRISMNGCNCLKEWREEGVGPKCNDYCCNPDGDTQGEWCFVSDPSCEESDWGYCLPIGVSLGSDRGATCIDQPGWEDSDGDDCEAYAQNSWCKDGRTGSGWHEEWGSFDQFSKDDVSASDACCSCGGGAMPEVGALNKVALGGSVLVALLLTCVLGGTALYYRQSYNKIAYGTLGDARGGGGEVVGKTVDDI